MIPYFSWVRYVSSQSTIQEKQVIFIYLPFLQDTLECEEAKQMWHPRDDDDLIPHQHDALDM